MPNKPLLVTGPAKTTGGKVIHTFINFTPWLTPNGRSCTRHNETTGMEPGGGAISAQNLGGGQKIINFWRVESEIGLKTSKNFHTTRVFQYWMFGREPYPTSLYSIGDSPPPPSRGARA